MNPVTLAVVKGGFEQIGDEMDLHLIHAAISPIISETNDCANGLFHPTTGETIAQGRYGLPVFLAYMQFTVQNLITFVETKGGFQEGDIWIVNDPYFGGSHLQDAQLVAPYFVDGTLFALMANTGHWMDIGGSVPGGWAPKATEIHQEGIIIPPLKLYEAGKLNQAVVDMIRANVRLPDQIVGDMMAMANVFTVGRRGLDGLVRRYGSETVAACVDEMVRRSETQMRSHIAEIPDGVYVCEDKFDNDGITDEPITMKLALTVTGDGMHLDFTGTAGRQAGPFNISYNTTVSSVFVAIKHIFPDVPVNGGTFRPITFTVPENSMLAAKYPAPVGAYTDPVCRIIDLVFQALAQAVPDQVPAPFFGTVCPTSVSGVHPRTNSYFVGVFPYPGGYGASRASDGLVNGTPAFAMALFMSLELSEHRFPLRFDTYALREDSGGAGWHRGGCGTVFGFTVTSDTVLSCLGDRTKFPPPGVAGGQPAQPNVVEFTTDGRTWRPDLGAKQEKLHLRAGDGVEFRTPGGGGFGDPLTRDVEAVEKDLNLRYISRDTAEQTYGVVISDVVSVAGRERYRIDRDATAGSRQSAQTVGALP